MRLLFYMTRYPGYAGIESVTSHILPYLKSDGTKISILSHLEENNPQCFTEGIVIYKMPDAVDAYTHKNYTYAEKIISEGHYDAIIYQDSYGYTERIVCPLAKKYKIPLYVFEHNSPLFIYNKRDLDSIFTIKGFLRRVLHFYLVYREKKRKRYLLEHCRKYVLLSKSYIPEFCNFVGTSLDNPQITYINNPCKNTLPDNKVQKENIILCVCRLDRVKQVHKMLTLWATINQRLGDWKFQIVGDGVEMDNLKAMVSERHIPRVEFVGYATPTEYYQRAKIFWMMSKFEGWPMTLFESMQYGCVPIAWLSFSSLRDIIDDGINGFVVRNEDSLTFGNKTIDLALDATLFQKMSQSARKKTELFTVDKIIGDRKKLLGI